MRESGGQRGQGSSDGLYQQDNASCHTDRIHAGKFLLMLWPDMNPIEHLWFELEEWVCTTSPPVSRLVNMKEGFYARFRGDT